MQTSLLFGAKNFVIYGVSARTWGLNQCGHFADKGGGGQFFADVFYGQPLRLFSVHVKVCITTTTFVGES